MVNRHPTTVYLDADIHDELRRLSQATGIPMAVIIRRGVQLAIADMVTREAAITQPLNPWRSHDGC